MKLYGVKNATFFLGERPKRVIAKSTSKNMGYPKSDVSKSLKTTTEEKRAVFSSVLHQKPMTAPAKEKLIQCVTVKVKRKVMN